MIDLNELQQLVEEAREEVDQPGMLNHSLSLAQISQAGALVDLAIIMDTLDDTMREILKELRFHSQIINNHP